ncbi:IclR family transcriptional regulator [Halorubrum sp. CSM-61]|uniref:IclR family transcriptional regulator n=1 Tax=Halorubrum sp. CSM-61 TaxID=2485838 RepID=UPI000F4D1B91|nr:IclR family transcriptional regulator [Halorubrum sp. CSM-61]
MVKAIEKTLTILNTLSAIGPSGTSELADKLEMPRSTIHHHLQVLESHQFVVNDSGTYRLTFRFLEIGQELRHQNELFVVGQSEISELTDNIGYPAGMYVKEHGSAVLVFRAGLDPTVPVTLYPGRHLPLHATAAGKALLASTVEKPRVERLAELPLDGYTDKTITSPDKLAEDIRTVSDNGYATATEERWESRCSVAVPVHDGRTRSAVLEAAVPAAEFSESTLETLTTELQQTVNVIQIKSEYSE